MVISVKILENAYVWVIMIPELRLFFFIWDTNFKHE